MSELFEIIIDGNIDGERITPSTIDIGTFSEYISDITALLKEKGKQDDKVFFELEEGSLKVKVLSTLMFLSSLSNDINAIENSGTLNNVSERRAKVFEKWQKHAKNNDSLSFNFKHNGKAIFRINKDSDIRKELSQFVEVERILYGEITDLGGKSKPNIHLDTEDGSITVYCSKNDLIDQENRLYKEAAIKVRTKQHISTFEFYGDNQFVEFIPYAGKLKGQALEDFINKHSKFWENIPDSSEWQRKLRDENSF